MTKTMRDAFFDELYLQMKKYDEITLITADFGAPSFDKIRAKFPSRVINVGIAEQNAINVGVGLALEGRVVFVYGIAPFISMRAFEQIRVNVAILSEFRTLNLNIIAVAVGMSYSTSGATHHCLEDLSLINTLPNIEIFSPSDYNLAKKYVKSCLKNNHPKYLRFDGEANFDLNLMLNLDKISLKNGFRILQNGSQKAIISTAFMSQKIALNLDKFKGVKIIDLFLINRFDLKALRKECENINTIITIEETFIGAGGLDSVINSNFKDKKVLNLGLKKHYCLDVGERAFLHEKCGLSLKNLEKIIKN